VNIRHALLADHLEEAGRVARWYFEQWGRRRPENTVSTTLDRVQSYGNRDCIPLMLLALHGTAAIGAATLKIREMDMFPEREHWLGGVYVDAAYRSRSVASRLIEDIVSIASGLGVHVLHLQTERLDGGLYARLGWVPRERVLSGGVEVLVMDRTINAKASV
jgi:GNAT superfamily N-acetyltransferase